MARHTLQLACVLTAVAWVSFCVLSAAPLCAAAAAVDESFDEVAVPLLPPNWTSTVDQGNGLGWFTVDSNAASNPNAAFTDDPGTITDRFLVMPPVNIVSNGQLRFLHGVDLDHGVGSAVAYDGVVLEISISAGPFVDILAAGGTFVRGGYDYLILPSSGNPLDDFRGVWSGTSDSYNEVVVNLPASANGHTVQFRWRMGTDAFESSNVGYLLDDVHIDTTDCLFKDSFEGNGNQCL